MTKINDLIQDLVEYEAHMLCRTNPGVSYGDLVQEGLLPMINDDVKEGQAKAYYKKIAFRAMVKWIKKEKMGGVVVNTYGGDRKSEEFKEQQSLADNVHVVSLDALPPDCDLSDTPSHFGRKTTCPDYDNDENDGMSANDRLTERWLRGRE